MPGQRINGPGKGPSALVALTGEISGALGDLGTFLPYAVAVLAAGILAPGPVFAGFAAGYLLVALAYRLPVAVQPMKALGAVVVTGGLTAVETAWAGTALGAILLLLAATPLLDRVARAIPQSVVTGLQVGLGLVMGSLALELMGDDLVLATGAAAVLALSFLWSRGPWALLVVGGAAAMAQGVEAPPPAAIAEVARQSGSSLAHAFAAGVLPQLPLTLLNAVILAAAVCRGLYGARAARVSERRLALTSGLLNVALAPFGALPLCHGAGGTAAHYRFGARGLGAPLVMAAFCAAGAFWGREVVSIVASIPNAVVGALLLYAAADLAFSRRLLDARPDCRPVIGAAAVTTLLWGAAAGLLIGMAAETLRAYVARRRTT